MTPRCRSCPSVRTTRTSIIQPPWPRRREPSSRRADVCGICGYFSLTGEPLERSGDTIRRMNAMLEHRGPDQEGYHLEPSIRLGVRRLSIQDLPSGSQPMFNEDRSIAVVFNGEIYNFHELREELIAAGHRFNSRCDTEVIVHLYEEYGAGCLEKMN